MKQQIPYGILATVTATTAWFIVALSNHVIVATNNIWPGDRSTLPVGLVLIQMYGALLFLIPATFIMLMFMGKRVQILNSPIVLAILASTAMVLLILAGIMCATPIISHGTYIGKQEPSKHDARPQLTEREQCFCGLSQLNAGCEAWAVTRHVTNGAPADWTGVTTYVATMSTHCPTSGSNYILTVVGKAPYCLTHGELLSDQPMQKRYRQWTRTPRRE